MRFPIITCAWTLSVILGISSTTSASDHYEIDVEHTSVNFKVTHLGISWVHGRFNELNGSALLDADPTKSSISMNIKVDSIDTKVKKRDEHLLSADFFDAKTHPEIVFKSTSIRPTKRGLEVNGTVTLHGKTKPLTFDLIGGKTAEFPPGVHRVGYSTSFVLKRSDFDMNTMPGAIGDEVHAEISFEAIKK